MKCLRVWSIVHSRFNLTLYLLSGSNSGDASDAGSSSSSSGGSCKGLDDDDESSAVGGGVGAAAVASAVAGPARSAAAAAAAGAAAAAAGGKLEGGSLKSRLKGRSDAAKKVRGLLTHAVYATMVLNRPHPALCDCMCTFVCRCG